MKVYIPLLVFLHLFNTYDSSRWCAGLFCPNSSSKEEDTALNTRIASTSPEYPGNTPKRSDLILLIELERKNFWIHSEYPIPNEEKLEKVWKLFTPNYLEKVKPVKSESFSGFLKDTELAYYESKKNILQTSESSIKAISGEEWLNNKEVDNVDLNEVALNCHTTIEFRPNLCDPDYEQTGDLHLLTWFIGKSEMPFNASVPFHKEKMKYIFKEHQPNLKRSAYLLNSNSLFGDMSSGLNTVLIESVIQKFSESSYDYICERLKQTPDVETYRHAIFAVIRDSKSSNNGTTIFYPSIHFLEKPKDKATFLKGLAFYGTLFGELTFQYPNPEISKIPQLNQWGEAVITKYTDKIEQILNATTKTKIKNLSDCIKNFQPVQKNNVMTSLELEISEINSKAKYTLRVFTWLRRPPVKDYNFAFDNCKSLFFHTCLLSFRFTLKESLQHCYVYYPTNSLPVVVSTFNFKSENLWLSLIEMTHNFDSI